MKTMRVVVAVVAASLLYSTAVLSEEKATGLSDSFGRYGTDLLKSHKDQCLIVALNCVGGDDSVKMRVERLNKEIEKGNAVYTPEELKGFQEQLNWIYYESGDFAPVRM